MMNKDQISALMEQTAAAMERVKDGMDVRDVMAHIYVEGLEDKTLDQGHIMADAIMASVGSFDSNFAEAKADADGWLDKTLRKVIHGMSPEERCLCLLKMTAAVNAASEAAMANGGIDREGIIAQMEVMTITPEQATPELEAELLEKAKEAISGSNVMMAAMTTQTRMLEQVEDSDVAALLLLDLGSREVDFRAVASMIAYTGVKNGTIDYVPVDLDQEQITTMVCAGIEQVRISAEVERGSIAQELAAGLLDVLGSVLIVAMIPSVALLGSALIVSLCGGIAAIPALLTVSVLTIWAGAKAVRGWGKLSERIVTDYCVALKPVTNGIGKIYDYMRSHVFPAVKERVIATWNWLHGKVGELAGRVRGEKTAEPEQTPVVVEAEAAAT